MTWQSTLESCHSSWKNGRKSYLPCWLEGGSGRMRGLPWKPRSRCRNVLRCWHSSRVWYWYVLFEATWTHSPATKAVNFGGVFFFCRFFLMFFLVVKATFRCRYWGVFGSSPKFEPERMVQNRLLTVLNFMNHQLRVWPLKGAHFYPFSWLRDSPYRIAGLL